MISGLLEPVPFQADEATRVGYIESFQDEFGNRRASDRAFLAHLLGVSVSPVRAHERMALDEQLWWSVANGQPILTGLISESDGLLVDPDAYAIEYRTMVELGALQAFWAIAIHDEDRELRDRALSAARWHIDELQPDNAINRPWGLPVFVELAIAEEDETIARTAELHAQTLLHNACINFGKPDLLSALILKDAIGLLEWADQCADL
jgi:hypothetical protein